MIKYLHVIGYSEIFENSDISTLIILEGSVSWCSIKVYALDNVGFLITPIRDYRLVYEFFIYLLSNELFFVTIEIFP